MSVSEKTRKALKEFGLTEYEAKVYISLVESGTQAASELSRTASIPYSKIYEILGNLERKGWVETEQGRPSKYYPKAPSTALESSRSRLETTLNSSQSDAMEELQPLYEKKGVREKPDIWIVRGQNNILDKIRETLGRTRRELFVAMPVVPDPIISMALPVLASGGVASLDDLKRLAAVPGVAGCVVGRALYTGALDLAEALRELASA